MTDKMCPLTWVAFILLVVGGLNWGLVGVFDFNLVTAILGKVPVLERIVYIVVGLSAIFVLIKAISFSKCCKPAQPEKPADA